MLGSLGIHQTGCVVGALRTLQGWNFASIMVEVRPSVWLRTGYADTLRQYRSHSGPTKHRYSDEQYIEVSLTTSFYSACDCPETLRQLFDPDLINVPPSDRLPSWFNRVNGDIALTSSHSDNLKVEALPVDAG